MTFNVAEYWHRYQKWIVSGSIFLMVVVIFGSLIGGWSWYRARASMETAQNYTVILQLLEEQRVPQAIAMLDTLIESAPKGYVVLSLLKKAMLLEQDDHQERLALFTMALEKVNQPSFKDFLHLRLALLLMKEPVANQLAIERYLIPIQESRAHPLSPMAMELSGYLAYRLGKKPEALSFFNRILEGNLAPPAMKGRIQVLKASLLSGESWPLVEMTSQEIQEKP